MSKRGKGERYVKELLKRSTSKSRLDDVVCYFVLRYSKIVDTMYRNDTRYRIRLQLQSTEWPGWVDEYYEYRLAIFASRCGDKTRKSQKAKVRQGRTRSAVGMFFPSSLSRSGRTKHPVLSRAADAGRNGSRVRGYSAIARFWNR